MGKVKLKTHKEKEYQQGIIRSLKKETQYLRKRIRQLENFIGDPEKRVHKEPVDKENLCPECNKGTLTEAEFAGRIFEVCFLCKYRKKIKALKKKK